MTNNWLRSVALTCCFFSCFATGSVSANSDSTRVEIQLQSALQLHWGSKTDTARLIVEKIQEELDNGGELNSRLGRLSRLYLAEITLKESPTFSTEQLLQLVEISTIEEEWDIVGHAHVLLALANELIETQDKAIWHINQAGALIKEHQLEDEYLSYYTRKSSLYRVFKIDRDSAILFAQKALHHAPAYAQPDKASAYFLLSSHTGNRNQKVVYLQKAFDVCKEVGDFYCQASMYINITRFYFGEQKLDSALYYSNQSMLLLSSKKDDIESLGARLLQYRFRAKIYKALGEMDSAWHYLNLSYDARDKQGNSSNAKTKAVLRVEEQRLKEQQAKQLQEEQNQRNSALILSLIATAIAGMSSYLYIRLRKVNRINKEQAKRLSHLNEMKSRFFANASHELRTPLTLLLGPIKSLIKDGQLDPKQQKLLAIANNSGEQLRELVSELLNLRKLELGKLEVTTEACHLADFFNRNCAQFESLASRKQINYTFGILIKEDVVGVIDREKCLQILNNLLSNAFKFTPAGESITVQIKLTGNILTLSVADTGPGIHPEDLPNIFDRYFQTNQPTKAIDGGTGIGLALCKEYATLFGGTILAESAVNKGVRFQVEFPIELLDQEASVEIVPEHLTAHSHVPTLPDSKETVVAHQTPDKSSTILVVEDNPGLSDYLRIVLSPYHNVITTENGQQAWQYLLGDEAASRSCDLILSDLMMPVMDGFQLLEKLKHHDATRHLPVIMLTARSGMRDKLKALRIGVDDYLLKPFEEEELQVRINNLLRNQLSRQTALVEDSTEQAKFSSLKVISAQEQAWLNEFELQVAQQMGNINLSIPLLANQFAMSESTLLRKLKRLTGLSTKQYLKTMRLEKARELIESSNYDSIAQVAYQTGYADPKSFSRAYKTRFGKLPSAQ